MAPQQVAEFSLTKARVNAGHSVRSLASEVGIDARTLGRLEAGEKIHPAKAKKIADFFEVQVTDLIAPEPESRKAA